MFAGGGRDARVFSTTIPTSQILDLRAESENLTSPRAINRINQRIQQAQAEGYRAVALSDITFGSDSPEFRLLNPEVEWEVRPSSSYFNPQELPDDEFYPGYRGGIGVSGVEADALLARYTSGDASVTPAERARLLTTLEQEHEVDTDYLGAADLFELTAQEQAALRQRVEARAEVIRRLRAGEPGAPVAGYFGLGTDTARAGARPAAGDPRTGQPAAPRVAPRNVLVPEPVPAIVRTASAFAPFAGPVTSAAEETFVEPETDVQQERASFSGDPELDPAQARAEVEAQAQALADEGGAAVTVGGAFPTLNVTGDERAELEQAEDADLELAEDEDARFDERLELAEDETASVDQSITQDERLDQQTTASVDQQIRQDERVDQQVDIRTDTRPDLAPDVRPDVRVDVRPDPRVDERTDLRPDERPDLQPDILPDLQPDVTPDVRVDVRTNVRPEPRADARPEQRPEPRPRPRPGRTRVGPDGALRERPVRRSYRTPEGTRETVDLRTGEVETEPAPPGLPRETTRVEEWGTEPVSTWIVRNGRARRVGEDEDDDPLELPFLPRLPRVR